VESDERTFTENSEATNTILSPTRPVGKWIKNRKAAQEKALVEKSQLAYP